MKKYAFIGLADASCSSSATSFSRSSRSCFIRQRLATNDVDRSSRTKRVECSEIGCVVGSHLILELLCVLARAGVGHAQLDLAYREHQIVLERFEQELAVVGIGEQARVRGRGFFQTQITSARGEPIRFGQSRRQHFGRDAGNCDRCRSLGTAEGRPPARGTRGICNASLA